jgi:hypothetical protein
MFSGHLIASRILTSAFAIGLGKETGRCAMSASRLPPDEQATALCVPLARSPSTAHRAGRLLVVDLFRECATGWDS